MLLNPQARLDVPDGTDPCSALARTTHLGIGAHADDLEFMALHGILAAYARDDRWFGGITCTDGAGSVGSLDAAALITRRQAEQREAARIGDYGFIAQLGYTSAEAKDRSDDRLTRDLATLIDACRPEIIYTHNPADRHPTHLAVVARTLHALHSLPRPSRPQRLLGCEVWRSLDWLEGAARIELDVSSHPELAARLADVFSTQIDGGKHYDRAVRGREAANATFGASHAADPSPAVWLAMDLTPLLEDDAPSLTEYLHTHLDAFHRTALKELSAYA
ncbi:MAG TPA: PIG-L family deacetylase [Kiritimatiellia bacterium]|mgnify:CR=1 FL=1|nr:PIG-L family deacetylase [Kiritimatiellia bacterium]HMP35280.1 PIG-L family deacetylase [Kiritimatiellia bacterium]